MNILNLTAPIKEIMQTKQIVSRSGKEYYFRDILLDVSEFNPQTGEVYPKFAIIQFSGAKCAELDNFHLNETVKVSFNLQSRSSQKSDGTTSWFTTACGFKIEYPPQQPATQPAPQNAPQQAYQQQAVQQTVYQQAPQPQYAQPVQQAQPIHQQVAPQPTPQPAPVQTMQQAPNPAPQAPQNPPIAPPTSEDDLPF